MKQLFKRLGANQKEVETFIRLLELGAQPASVIAKHMGMPRSTMYLVLSELKKMQLVEEFEREGIKFFKCIPVDHLVDILRAKEREIQKTEALLEEKLPELKKLENKLSITPKVRFFEGKEGVSKVYELVLREKEFWAYFDPKLVKEHMPEYHFKIPEALRGKGGKARELLVDSPEAQEYLKRYNSDRHQIRILTEQVKLPSDTIICSEKLYMIAYGENSISATEIISPAIAQSQRTVFEMLWEQLSS